MQQALPLTGYLEKYSDGTLGRKELEANIFTHVLAHARRYRMHCWPYDERVDYLCWLYPRLCRSIEKYKEKSSSFDTYIAMLIHWSMKEYKAKEADRSAFEYAYWEARAVDDLLLGENDPEYLSGPESVSADILPRQLLILVLKCYRYLSADYVQRAAKAIGIAPETLEDMIDALRKMRREHDTSVETLKEHINSQYYRCISFAERMRAAPENSAHKDQMKKRLENARLRLEKMRKRLKEIRQNATNAEIAKILTIPKGTVDSTLHKLKWKWKVNKA